MSDRFRRAQVTDPHTIQAAMLSALQPEDRKLLNYRGTEARQFFPADRRAFHADPQSYLSTFQVTSLGSLRVAFITDRRGVICATQEPGLDAYSLCLIKKGSAGLRSPPLNQTQDARQHEVLIYKGAAGNRFTSSDDHARLNVWIPAEKLQACLEALAGRTMSGEFVFSPRFDTTGGAGAAIGRLLGYLESDLSSPHSLLADPISAGLFEDLLCRSIVQRLKHSYSDCLIGAASASAPVPRIVRRAEAFIYAHAEQPVGLQEIAQAAGCSVRALQLGFRRFRGTTPVAAMRQARLEAVRRALACGDAEGTTVGEVARRYGFTNPGRFARLYTAAFGISPADALPRRPLRALR